MIAPKDRTNGWASFVVCAAGVLSGCAHVVPPLPPSSTRSSDAASTKRVSFPNAAQDGSAKPEAHAAATAEPSEVGRASYYSDKLEGRRTASGEPYDPKKFTAAHRTLAFGTRVEVRRPDGASVVVTINDRGPFGSSERVIDLSRAAAEALGMIRAGVVDIELFVLGTER